MRFVTNIDDALSTFLKGSNYSSVFLLTDHNTNRHCMPMIAATKKKYISHVFNVQAGESTKNIDTCICIWTDLNNYGADRSSLLINLGGGMITDLGGFVASTYKRGIDFLNIPTSMLAMIDASVGGKNGINLGVLKNQIGTINDPVDVFVFPDFLKTLDRRNYLSGYAEALKHGFLDGIAQLNLSYQFSDPLIDSRFLSFLESNIAFKQRIVDKDPQERVERKMLNFGHTVGHALESLMSKKGNPVLHGEAVAWGMAAELYLSAKQYGFPENIMLDYMVFLKETFTKLPFENNDVPFLLQMMNQDKKNRDGIIKFALLSNLGEYVIDCSVEESLIINALKAIQ